MSDVDRAEGLVDKMHHQDPAAKFFNLVQTLEDGLRHFITMPVHVFRLMVIIPVGLI